MGLVQISNRVTCSYHTDTHGTLGPLEALRIPLNQETVTRRDLSGGSLAPRMSPFVNKLKPTYKIGDMGHVTSAKKAHKVEEGDVSISLWRFYRRSIQWMNMQT